MLYLVTGASGFIASHVVDALLARGRGTSVRALGRRHPEREPAEGYSSHLVDYRAPGLGVDPSLLEGADVLIHAAGQTRGRDAADFRRGNVDATRSLLETLATLKDPPRRIVYLSSQAAAGPATARTRPVREEDAPAPVEGYGLSKLEGERLAAVKAREMGVESTVIRPAAVYGPRDRDFLSVFRMVRRGIAVYPGIREQWISLVHVADAVDAILRASESTRAAGRTYFVGGEALRWVDVYHAAAAAVAGRSSLWSLQIPRGLVRLAAWGADLVSRATGRSSILTRSKAQLGAQRYWLCEDSRIRSELGWAPSVALHDGMRDAYDWYRRHSWI